jgi:hypothetical protein
LTYFKLSGGKVLVLVKEFEEHGLPQSGIIRVLVVSQIALPNFSEFSEFSEFAEFSEFSKKKTK